MCTPRRYRLVVDESLALGVLGEHGRGACEHWGLRPGDAEIVSASIGALPAFLSISLAAKLTLVSCPQSCIQRRSQQSSHKGRQRAGSLLLGTAVRVVTFEHMSKGIPLLPPLHTFICELKRGSLSGLSRGQTPRGVT